MNAVFSFILAVLFTVSASAQGTIYFNNRTPTGDAPVMRPNGVGAGAGAAAQLFLVGTGGALTPLLPSTTFRTTSAAAMFFVNPVTVAVPGIPAGSPATVRMRVWDGISYEFAVANGLFRGESSDVSIAQLGGLPPDGSPPIPDPGLNGLLSFVLIPEPSTLLMGMLGAAWLAFRKRR